MVQKPYNVSDTQWTLSWLFAISGTIFTIIIPIVQLWQGNGQLAFQIFIFSFFTHIALHLLNAFHAGAAMAGVVVAIWIATLLW